MEPIQQNVTATISVQIQKVASNWLYYEIWTTEDYWWFTSFAVELLFLLLFLIVASFSACFYYRVERHPLVLKVQQQPSASTVQKKKES
jgi:type VI protein secretion system component VasK